MIACGLMAAARAAGNPESAPAPSTCPYVHTGREVHVSLCVWRFLILHVEQGMLYLRYLWHLSFCSITDIPSPLREPSSVSSLALVLEFLTGAACRIDCQILLSQQQRLDFGAMHDSEVIGCSAAALCLYERWHSKGRPHLRRPLEGLLGQYFSAEEPQGYSCIAVAFLGLGSSLLRGRGLCSLPYSCLRLH